MKPKIDYSLYLVTDRELMSTSTLEEAVEDAIKGGVTLVQLREKTASSLEFYNTALKIKEVTDSYGVPLIINDRVDIAAAVDAAGVHIGQSDLPVSVVRKIIGEDKIIGVSAASLKEAVKAQEDGADYLGIGAMFPTGTKKDADFTSMEELKKIVSEVSLPIVVIGGINESTVPSFKGIKLQGFAVVSSIIAAKDVKGAAEKLKALV